MHVTMDNKNGLKMCGTWRYAIANHFQRRFAIRDYEIEADSASHVSTL